MERVRNPQHLNREGGESTGSVNKPQFVNPFAFMSDDDARVYLELQSRQIPFSYRYFNGNAPTVKQLIPDFAPEFTLPDYKMVIIIFGAFFGTLPGVLDQAALAQVALFYDGWKTVELFSSDVEMNLSATLDRLAPELIHPAITGPPIPGPFDAALKDPSNPVLRRRRDLQGRAILRKHYMNGEVVNDPILNRILRRRGRQPVLLQDSGRHRTNQSKQKPSFD